MYLYSVGYSSHEDCPRTELSHEKQFSDDELGQMVVDACPEVVKKRKDDDHWIHSFDDVWDDVVEVLIRDHGFERVKYEATCIPFGWPSIFVKDWGHQDDPFLDKIREKLADAGYTEADDSFFEAEDDAEDDPEEEASQEKHMDDYGEEVDLAKGMDVGEMAGFKTMLILRDKLIGEGLPAAIVDRVIGRVSIEVSEDAMETNPEAVVNLAEAVAIILGKSFRALQEIPGISRPDEILVDMASNSEIILQDECQFGGDL